MDDELRLQAGIHPVVSYAMAHNRITPVRTVTLRNAGPLRTGVVVSIAVTDDQGPLSETCRTTVDLDAGAVVTLHDLPLVLTPSAMNQVEESRPGSVRIVATHEGRELALLQVPVTVLASRQWLNQPPGLAMELLAAHVMPNAPEVTALLPEVAATLAERTGLSQIDGYQSGPERVDEIVRALFGAVQRRQIHYSEPPASWADNGQKVRTPKDIADTRLATCLDTSVLFAAALEQAGIRPQIWVLDGHAFVGWWRAEVDSWTAVSAEVGELINRLDVGQLAVLETTLATVHNPPASFEQAVESAGQRLRGNPSAVIGVLDVWAARRSGILPLPALRSADDGTVQSVFYQPGEHSVAPAEREPVPQINSAGRPGKPVPARVQQWKNALLDLSLRNRLINFTGRGSVALHLPGDRLGDLEDLLLRQRQLTLAPDDAFDEVYRHRDGIRSARDLPPDVLADALVRKASVYTELAGDSYLSRLRSLSYKARTLAEETGANNLYLALGSLVWQLDGRELRSPLILVPVHLKVGALRTSTFRISLDEAGSSTPNYCLLEKLRLTFGLHLQALAEPATDGAGIDLAATFTSVRAALLEHGVPFRVEETVSLGVLQFAKFRLWKDVEENWERLLEAPLVRHLVESPTAEFVDPVPAPERVDLDELALACPISVDGSQASAIAEAMAGRTFVLEGPPGTGKSQTIANLLARGIAEGRRVLFVAEKRAALDVVSRRVEAIGLGAFTLDLHDRLSRPAVVRQQVTRALELAGRGDLEGLAAGAEATRAAGAALTRYATRLHEPNGAGLSLYSAVTAGLAQDNDVPPLTIAEHVVRPGAEPAVAQLRALTRELPYVADPAFPSERGPWSFAAVDDPADVDVASVATAARTIDATLVRLDPTGPLGGVVRAARTPGDLQTLDGVLGSGLGLGVFDEVRTPRWRGAATSAVQDLAGFVGHARTSLGVATAAVLDLPLADIHARAVDAARSGWWGRRKRLRLVADELLPVLRPGASVHPRDLVTTVQSLLQLQLTMGQQLARLAGLPGVALPSGWNPVAHGPDAVQQQVRWLEWAASLVSPDQAPGSFGYALRQHLAVNDEAGGADLAAVRDLAGAFGAVARTLNASDEALARWSGTAGLLVAWQQTAGRRDTADPRLGSLVRWLELRRHLAPLLALGLADAHRQLLTGEVTADEAGIALERGLAAASVAERRRSQGLDAFDESAHARTIQRFGVQAGATRTALADALPMQALQRRTFAGDATAGEVGALRRELARQRGGLTVRELMTRHGRLITQIMPCVLVSPDSLARFFPVEPGLFDLVVFDEASQIRVADAVGAIGRGRSVVVVGDSKQMPPTSFAEVSTRLDEDAELADETDIAIVEDEESILSECVQARVGRRWLSWHYRSQDESLIAFSNARYYDGKLSTFPAPTVGTADPGVEGHGISWVRLQGEFLRSGKGRALRTNPVEAQAVLSEIRRRFDAAPQGTMPSIGVVTFNLQQRTLIEELVRDTEDPRLIAALDDTRGDGLFVKNLENVQGDERDVILFSTAFSVNERGVLPLNFGPLNNSGGERRLNVAITRARRQVIIFSSFDPSQLRAEETSSVGVRHLREYLDVAAGGQHELESASRRSLTVDRHRDAIAERLREHGVVVATDVGLSDFRVDLQLTRTAAPAEPLVAVILDGPAWARRATVGDRDGTPSQVLKGLLHWPAVERVWLPSWLDNPDAVIDRLVRAVAEAQPVRHTQQTTTIVAEEPEPEGVEGGPVNPGPSLGRMPDALPEAVARVESGARTAGGALVPPGGDAALVPRAFQAWQPEGGGSIATLDAARENRRARDLVTAALEAAIAAEGPIHADRLAKAVAGAFGLQKVAQSRAAAILACAARRPDSNGFYWPVGLHPDHWDDHRPDPDQQRPIEHISPHELINAMRHEARRSGGIGADELKATTRQVFGFKRLTAGVNQALDGALAFGLSTGRLIQSDGLVHPGRWVGRT